MRYTRFKNCHLCDNGRIYKNTDIYIDNENGTIVEKPNSKDIQEVDLEGKIVAPGFIDIQNNGVYGLNFSNLSGESTAEDIEEFRRFYRDAMSKYLKTGVTATCPTVTSNFGDVYQKVLPMYKRSRSTVQTDSLGAHIEGPFINKEKKGCHPVETFVDAKDGQSSFSRLYGEKNLLDNVCILTAAPEMPGVVDAIPQLVEKDIVFSIGHTMASHATGLKAVENGATMITHLYNAMPQPHHRDAGVVGLITSPSASKNPYFGLICDGVHVDPSMAVIAYRSSPDKCILVTDAMHLIGLPDGSYKWGAQVIEKEGYRLYLKGTSTLAGAATTLPETVRNLIKWTGISLAEAVATVTNNPARSIGVSDKKGFLNPGCDADLVVLDETCHVQRIYKLGKEIPSLDATFPQKLMASL